MPRAVLTLALLGALAAPAAAQAPKSIDPGMSQAQVVERLGEPNALRTAGTFTYLFYKNGCVKECGMDDLVLLENDAVVDAIFRSPERAYSGKSSSPRAIPADVAVRGRPAGREAAAPGPEVTQQGSPREAAAPATTEATKPDTTQPTPEAAKPTPAATKPAPEAAKPTSEAAKPAVAPKPKEERPEVDSAKSAAQPAQPSASPASSGTLRIPIKTKPRPPKADSSQSGAAGTKSPT